MVQKAQEIGIKPAARMFLTSPVVVRKWLKRFKTDGYCALADRSHRSHFCPQEAPVYLKEHIVALRNNTNASGLSKSRL